MINQDYPSYGCSICNAQFQVIESGKLNEEKTKKQLENHLANCSKNDNYTEDENIVTYQK